MFTFPQFAYKGFNSFTKQGFLHNAKEFEKPDQVATAIATDKVILISGANSGIGYVTALELAKKGATLHMLNRNKEKGEKALEELKKETNNNNIYNHVVDISSMKNISNFYQKFNDEFKGDSELAKCDVLIHNAGMIAEKYELTDEGIELSFATNLLGHYHLTQLMLPNLQVNKPSRVVFVSSGGMFNAKLNSEDPELNHNWIFNGTASYAQHKRQGVELCKVWATKIYKDTGILFYSMHPGWCRTPGVTKSLPTFDKILGESRLRTSLMGADTTLWLALCEEPKQYKEGDFFFDRKIDNPHLPLAHTQATESEVELFLTRCESRLKQALEI